MASTVTMTKGVAADAFTFTSNVAADDTVVIGNQTYVFKASVTTTANQVKVGTDLSTSIDNLVAAINKAAGGGSTYGSATVANPYVTATKSGTTKLSLAARGAGSWVNGLYLAATAPGANDIAANGVTFAAVSGATLGAGNVDDFITALMQYNQLNAEVLYELHKLTAAAD